ncbi:hypothetical protein HOP60_21095 [Halomonas daqingensis]|uniref:Uncharacterized protein n=1 Tax=Billgrantia desiderata TaxID=52021 RepID=A0ABS9BBD7_9GAMM|nr:hypothetical protein [Halomonas desiderata]MCE8044634.1 hypothetical protein [Halomonas desiderata]MCE8049208.1 hypothetical protein [Halomonas desiderata]
MNFLYSSSKSDRVNLPRKTFPECYKKAQNLFMSGLQYEKLSRIFCSVYGSGAWFEFCEGAYHVKYKESIDYRYSVLEGLGHGKSAEVDITGVIYHWLNDEEEGSCLSRMITEKATVKGGRVVYDYDPGVVYYLAQHFPQREEVLPEEFVFPWGGVYETHSLINSLYVRCAYHVLTVELVARKRGMKGGAESSLLLVIDRNNLINDIDYLASVGRENIEKFLDFMTYGKAVRSPDPALQPLVVSRSGMFLIPCYFVLTSNTQRNMLSLMARVTPDSFHRQSKIFEHVMVRNIANNFSGRGVCVVNRHYGVKKQREEIDAIILDEGEEFCLILELRWMLQPGDAREVINRLGECRKKVAQLERKIDFVKKNKESVLSDAYGKNIGFTEWTVNGAVVVQGFGGCLSSNPTLPIVTIDVLLAGLSEVDSLRELYRWICSLSWLPKEGVHFKPSFEDIDVGGIKIRRPCIELLVDQKNYVEGLSKSWRF